MAATPPPRPINLVPLRAAASSVVAWYEAFLAGRPPPVEDLNVPLEGLRGLPPMGGQLGRAVAIIAAGGAQATTEQTIAALETLRAFAGLRRAEPVPSTTPEPAQPEAAGSEHSSTAQPTRRRRQGRSWTQPRLPGIDHQ